MNLSQAFHLAQLGQAGVGDLRIIEMESAEDFHSVEARQFGIGDLGADEELGFARAVAIASTPAEIRPARR